MKYLKMFGLAAAVAAALMAFVGAGTASAGELCTEPAVSNMCPAGKQITEVDMSLAANALGQITGTQATTGGTVLNTCTASTIKLTPITQGTGAQVSGAVSEWTWGAAGTACSVVTSTLTRGNMDFTLNAAGETTITSTGNEWTINTGLFGSCVFSATDVGSVPQGGNTLTINAVVTRISGLCPETTTWKVTYKITNHNAVYLIGN